MTADLRAAFDHLVDDIDVPAGFAAEARGRRHRSRRRRLAAGSGASLAAVSLVAAATAAAVYRDASRRPGGTLAAPAGDPTPAAPAGGVVDGVGVTFLPAGLTPGPPTLTRSLNSPGSLRVTESFTRPGTGGYLAVSVQRGAPTDLAKLAATLASNTSRTTTHTSVESHPALLSTDPGTGGTTFLEWVVGPTLSLSVTDTTGFLDDADLRTFAAGLTDDGTPGRPADPLAAMAEIRQAFTTAFAHGTARSERLSAVASGPTLAQRDPAPYETDLGYLAGPVAVPDEPTDLVFTDPLHAVLLYRASDHNDPNATGSTPGYAVYIDGTWKVATSTWCAAVGLDDCPTP